MLTIQKITEIVSEYTGIPIHDIYRKTRKREIVEARQLSMYFSRERTGASLFKIGLEHNGSHHSTVIHGVQMVKDLMAYDRTFQKKVAEINQKLDVEMVRLGLNMTGFCPCCNRPLN